MKIKKITILLLTFGCILFLINSCNRYTTSGASSTIILSSESFHYFKGEFENTAYFKKHKPRTIAVLPFADKVAPSESDIKSGIEPVKVVRRGMYNHISSLPFKDTEIFITDKRLKNAGLLDPDQINRLIAEKPRKLKSILGVDAVITGTVTNFDRFFLGIYSQIAVGCEVKLWDLNTGKLLWRAKHVSRAHAGGISLNPIGLVLSALASVWNLRDSEFASQTDELFREIVSSIEVPRSELTTETPPPRITFFAALNTEKPFTLGRKAVFRLIGDPNCSAYVNIGEFKHAVNLEPVSAIRKQAFKSQIIKDIKKNYKAAGLELTFDLISEISYEVDTRAVYEGYYTVEPDDQAYGLIAKGYLINEAGMQETALDFNHPVNIDARPPVAPQGLTASGLDKKIKIIWNPNQENDLQKYEVWTSSTPLNNYTIAATIENNAAIIENLANFEKVFIKIKAVDKAGNQSRFSRYAKASPLPRPGLYNLPQPGSALGGLIKNKVLLIAENNPYTVVSNISINKEGAVFIEPGVELYFAPNTRLTVNEGELSVFGTLERPVRFLPKTGHTPGAWQGIHFNDTTNSSLNNLIIQSSSTGLIIKNSALTVSGVIIRGCSQAGIYLKDRARPNITCSIIEDNEGLGGMMIQGEGLAPVIRNNIFRNNKPFQVQSYTPLKIDLQYNFWGSSQPEQNLFIGDLIWQPFLSNPPQKCN